MKHYDVRLAVESDLDPNDLCIAIAAVLTVGEPDFVVHDVDPRVAEDQTPEEAGL